MIFFVTYGYLRAFVQEAVKMESFWDTSAIPPESFLTSPALSLSLSNFTSLVAAIIDGIFPAVDPRRLWTICHPSF